MSDLKPGQVIVVPRGSHVTYGGQTRLQETPTKIRKYRLGVVEYVFDDLSAVVFTDKGGRHPWTRIKDAQIVSTDDHTLSVHRKKLGGHPIAGWNWPLWGYDYVCACGEKMGDREDHAFHLEDLLDEAKKEAK